MKTLLLIPSALKTGIEADVLADRHPAMDYDALAAALRAEPESHVELLDYAAVDSNRAPLVRLARKCGGRDAALAMLGYLRRNEFDAIFSNGENVALPLALLLKTASRRPGHVCIGHRLSAGKKRLFFTLLKAQRQIDTVLVYAQAQRDFAEDRLGIPASQISLIPFHADDRFYSPRAGVPLDKSQICAAGREGRDYPTLLEAVADQSALMLKMTTASPWSKRADQTEGRELPPNVDVRRYDYPGLRALYASSLCVAVPLLDNDFPAGITTILEGMAMGKAVVATCTPGQADIIVDGENGLLVAPEDVAGWRQAIARLRRDTALRERIGRAARRWVEENATLDRWVANVAHALHQSAASISSCPDSRLAPASPANG